MYNEERPPQGGPLDRIGSHDAAPTTSQYTGDSAARLDKRIRLLVGTITDNWTKLVNLVEEAQRGEIHKALGFRSWTAYVADVFTVPARLDRPQRQQLVAYLSGEGMSQRAIADVVAVDQKTVSNDLRAREENSSPEAERVFTDDDVEDWVKGRSTPVIGLDGKTYQPKPPKPYPSTPAPGTQPEPSKPRRGPITDSYGRAVYDLKKIVERLGRLTTDDRFGRNRNELRRQNLGDLLRIVNKLDDEVLCQLSGGFSRGPEGRESLDDPEFVKRLLADDGDAVGL
jgi:hypothetical protein